MMYRAPGLYREDVLVPPPAELQTGVPVFLGYTAPGAPLAPNTPQDLHDVTQFPLYCGAGAPNSYLAAAVRGFFRAGGTLCYVVRLDEANLPVLSLRAALTAVEALAEIDLVCAPDIMRPLGQGDQAPNPADTAQMQTDIIDHCDRLGNRFCILDSPPMATLDQIKTWRGQLKTNNGALYYPWIRIAGAPAVAWNAGFIPPCGHVAGIYALTDQSTGLHKAPANEVIGEALDLEFNLGVPQQAELNPLGINCLRSFPGRGIRVWGARTLSLDPAWTYVNVRRVFLTAGRWIALNLESLSFEPIDITLIARIERELNAYFTGLFLRGALKGATPEEAFYVKCDDETNPPEVREAGTIVTEIGLAPGIPSEFVVVRLIHSGGSIQITQPAAPG